MEGISIALAVVRRFFQDNAKRYYTSESPQQPITFDPLESAEATNHLDCKDSSSANKSRDVLNVITYNTWGVPVAPMLESRFHNLCCFIAGLSKPGFGDVVCFQEVSTGWQKQYLTHAGLQAGLRFVQEFNHGVGFPGWYEVEGTGLMVLSRYPILECRYHRFSINGRPQRIHHSDYLGHKGVALVRVLLPCGETVDVYTTHLHASYVDTKAHKLKGSRDGYKATRVAQSWELAQFIEDTQKSQLVVIAGDFNCDVNDIELRLPVLKLGLTNAIESAGHTYGSSLNSHTKDSWLPQCLDHVLYRTSDTNSSVALLSASHLNWKANNGISVSDHLGVAATFEIVAQDTPSSEKPSVIDEDEVCSIVHEAISVLHEYGTGECKRDMRSHMYHAGVVASVVGTAIGALTLQVTTSTICVLGLLGIVSMGVAYSTIELAVSHFVVKSDLRNFEHILLEMKLFTGIASAMRLANGQCD